jgi:hypothetical protein
MSVSRIVTYASGSTEKTFSDNTNDNGQISYSFTIGRNSKPGNFKVDVNVSAAGYKDSSKSGSFKVRAAAAKEDKTLTTPRIQSNDDDDNNMRSSLSDAPKGNGTGTSS